MKAIVMEALTKQFPQGKIAVDHVSISLEQGEIFGFLGPNGAGKTTTVKLLNGMLTPTAGTCRVFDMDPFSVPEKVHGLSGVVTEHAQMYDNLTGLQNLLFYASVFGLNESQGKARASDLLRTLELDDAKDRKLAAYSTGMRQRLSLARAMLHRPKILFLDEPTSGLDPVSAQSVNQMIKRLAEEEGSTIFLCTHQLRYAQEICSAYGLMDDGKVLALGDITTLRTMVFSGLTVIIQASLMPGEIQHKALGDQRYEVIVESEKDIPAIIRRIVESGGDIFHVSTYSLSLEDIYFALLERQKKSKEVVN